MTLTHRQLGGTYRHLGPNQRIKDELDRTIDERLFPEGRRPGTEPGACPDPDPAAGLSTPR